jgi:hypothetical protein
MAQKELPLVALFCQKKIAFRVSRLYTTIGARHLAVLKTLIFNLKIP